MAVSPVPEPGLSSAHARLSLLLAPARACEFTLSAGHPPRQLACENPNPLCALFSATRLGAAVCDRGCGLPANADAGSLHHCPFGMASWRLNEAGAEAAHWRGRRFTSIRVLHAALDLLVEEGIDEEAILEAMPGDPVVDADELLGRPIETAAAGSARVIAMTESAPFHPEPQPGPGASGEPAAVVSMATVIEYLDQMQALLNGSSSAEGASQRFLKGIGALLPMRRGIVLIVREGGVAPASLTGRLRAIALDEREGGPSALDLARSPAVEQALHAGHPMVEADGEVAPFPDRLADAMIIALPLVSGSRTLGVWIGEVGAAVRSADEVRMLPLLADFLAARLRELLPAPGGVVPSWSREALLAALEPEAARSLRGGGTLALIDLRIEAPRDVKFDIARLSGSMRAMLRPYDLLAVAEDAPGRCWRVVLPLSGGEGPLPAAHRLCTLVEDFLDSEGGVEERGIRVGLGISVLPADAANTEEMVENAAAAAVRALAHAEPSAVVLHEATQEAVV